MEHLDFILWMILFPIAISLSAYIDEMKYKIIGEKKVFSKETEAYAGLFIVIIWFFVGYQLF